MKYFDYMEEIKLSFCENGFILVRSILSRSGKNLTTFEHLLGDELYNYHSKLKMREGRTGG